MEGIILIGIPGSGKSTFYKNIFSKTHELVSLDLVKTRSRESRLIARLIRSGFSFVIDNTNPTKEIRGKYIALLKLNGYRIVGYNFDSNLIECFLRNNQRMVKNMVPDIAIKAILGKMELPTLSEGFDELYDVKIIQGIFEIEVHRK